MATVGYARVSSSDQDLTVQIEQLEAAGCTKIFSEKKSGTKLQDRSELEKCLNYVREGDVLVFTRIDRLARSVRDFSNILASLDEKSVGMRCLLQPFDSTTPSGKLMRDMLAAFAEFETTVRRERQMEGIAAAKARGAYIPKLNAIHSSKLSAASRRLRKGQSYAQVAASTGISDDLLRLRFPDYNKKAYSRAGSETKVPYKGQQPAPETALEPETAAPATPVAEEPKSAPRRPGFFGRFAGQR